jgi:hypothetical protein
MKAQTFRRSIALRWGFRRQNSIPRHARFTAAHLTAILAAQKSSAVDPNQDQRSSVFDALPRCLAISMMFLM